MAGAENILLIRFKSIGDILFLLPAVHRVREHFPDARITFLTSRENAPLLEGFREVNEVITLDRSRLRCGHPLVAAAEILALLRRLRSGRYSLAVDFQGYVETAWLAWWTRAPRRWGNVYNKGRRWAYTCGVTRNETVHHIDWYLSLLEQCGLAPGSTRNEFVLPEPALAEARAFLESRGLAASRPLLFVQPLTSSPKKNWPLERYLAVAQHWQEHGRLVLFGGGPGDRAALEPVQRAGFPVSAGVPMLVTGGLMKLSTLILGGDTGALHLAMAMGKRVVMVRNTLASGSPYPYRHPEWALVPDSGRDISRVAVDRVVDACERALAEVPAPQATSR